jgi:hypothetical protein
VQAYRYLAVDMPSVAGCAALVQAFVRGRETRSIPSREQALASLGPVQGQGGAGGEEFDLLVIGGGSTGAGAALDAATRGLRVACVERYDFGSGTSSRSTKVMALLYSPLYTYNIYIYIYIQHTAYIIHTELYISD